MFHASYWLLVTEFLFKAEFLDEQMKQEKTRKEMERRNNKYWGNDNWNYQSQDRQRWSLDAEAYIQ